jgi:ComF family protein
MVLVGPYGPVLGSLVRAYKYHGREDVEPLIGGWLVDVVNASPWRRRVQAIVSAPTYWKRRLGRPFHAAEMLGSFLARQTRLPHLPILRRVQGGPHQIGLSYTARVANVKGAFAIRKGVTLRDARLLLVDDVKTTGATLEECAKVLRKGGATEVYGAILAKVGGSRSTATIPDRQSAIV